MRTALRRASESAPRVALVLLALGFALRFLVAASLDAIPEEAYYWCYAAHPAAGYLDHPPLVAWLIAAGERVFGHSELAIRSGSLACGVVLAWIAWRATSERHGARAGWFAAALTCATPYAFASNSLATPEAPLLVACAGALWQLRRALLDGRGRAWLGAGLFLGLGLLAKYTALLLVPAAIVFCCVDRASRRWFVRFEPYVALSIALALFLPVIAWNAENGWSSFAFQTARRVSEPFAFELHLFLASALLMAGPLLPLALWHRARAATWRAWDRELVFDLVFTLVPLSVFALHSLSHPIKLHWSGPFWIALVPAAARELAKVRPLRSPTRAWLAQAGVVFAVVLGFVATTAWHPPGTEFLSERSVPIAWSELSALVHAREDELEAELGRPLMIVGADKNFLASELAFYDEDGDGAGSVTSRHVFGRSDLMFERWHPVRELIGRDMLVVAYSPEALADARIAARFASLGEVERIAFRSRGRVLAELYVRLGVAYEPASLALAQ